MTDTRTYPPNDYGVLRAVNTELRAEIDAQRMWRLEAEQTAQWGLDEVRLLNAQLATLRQQLAEAMTMCAQLEAERDSYRARYDTVNANHAERYGELQRVTAELEDAKHLSDAWKREAMEARMDRAQLVAERDEANRRADDAVASLEAYSVAKARNGQRIITKLKHSDFAS